MWKRSIISAAIVIVVAIACNSQRKSFDGPTVDAFNGRVTVDGKPVSFPAGEEVILNVWHQESSKMWGIPIQSDGTFKIGWMPIGTYTGQLIRASKSSKGRGRNLYALPNSFKIVDGQTEYLIDLGKDFKP